MKLLVDSIFTEFRHLLKYHVLKIRLVENLHDPEDGLPLAGFVSKGRRHIYLDKDQCEHEKIKTLIHELAHILLPSVAEKDIQKIEELLWQKFSRKQKEFLEKRIPKRVSKVRPK